MATHSCTLRVTLFSTNGKFRLVSGCTPLTQAAHSCVLLLVIKRKSCNPNIRSRSRIQLQHLVLSTALEQHTFQFYFLCVCVCVEGDPTQIHFLFCYSFTFVAKKEQNMFYRSGIATSSHMQYKKQVSTIKQLA